MDFTGYVRAEIIPYIPITSKPFQLRDINILTGLRLTDCANKLGLSQGFEPIYDLECKVTLHSKFFTSFI